MAVRPADAAALAAAEDDRQQLFDGFLDALDDREGRQDWWVDAVAPLTGDGCGAASASRITTAPICKAAT